MNVPGPITGRAIADQMLDQPGVFHPSGDWRIVQGIAATGAKNANGDALPPETARVSLPIPLLFGHDWEVPIGRVKATKVTPDGLWFEARLIDGVLPWANECWFHLLAGRIPAASVCGRGTHCKESPWDLFEISLCEQGACKDARVHVVKTVFRSVVFFDGRREKIHLDRASV